MHDRLACWIAAVVVCAGASRAVAAGDVAAEIDKSGALRLTGDDLPNDVQVDRDPWTREFVVRGRNGTTVNGAAEWRAASARSVRVEMGAGDDVVALAAFRVAGGMVADLGDGNDTLSLMAVRLGGRAVVTGGAGDDAVKFEGGCDLRGGAAVTTSDGADLVRIADSYAWRPVRIVTGNGDDAVEVHRNGFTEGASLVVRTGEGDDRVDLLANTMQSTGNVVTAAGQDRVSVVTTRFRRAMVVSAGTGDDDVTVERATFDETLRVYGGEGTNRATFIGIHITSNGSGVTAGASGGHDNVFWWVVIVHVFP